MHKLQNRQWIAQADVDFKWNQYLKGSGDMHEQTRIKVDSEDELVKAYLNLDIQTQAQANQDDDDDWIEL